MKCTVSVGCEIQYFKARAIDYVWHLDTHVIKHYRQQGCSCPIHSPVSLISLWISCHFGLGWLRHGRGEQTDLLQHHKKIRVKHTVSLTPTLACDAEWYFVLKTGPNRSLGCNFKDSAYSGKTSVGIGIFSSIRLLIALQSNHPQL